MTTRGPRTNPTRTDVRLVPMDATHAAAVLEIYATGIATGLATFRQDLPTWAEFTTSHLDEHRLVALDEDDTVLGWVAVSPVSGRSVYAGVVELSVYVAASAHGRGVGRALLDGLTTSARRGGVWTLQAGVFSQNLTSLALHRSAGFRVVGTRERLGLMPHGPLAGTWLDVVLLERRL